MFKKKENRTGTLNQTQTNNEEQNNFLKRKTIKDLIAPSGIDASHIDHLEIISSITRYARSFNVWTWGY